MKEGVELRTWRVGTISMGASLLFLGIFLLLSQFAGFSLSHIMISWWPIILIVLGVEILAYIFLSRKEKPLLKYDFLSIFFVGIIGMVGIGFAILSSTGLLDAIDDSLSQEEKTFELPTLTEKVDASIKRIVLDADQYPVKIEGTASQEVTMFGTYTASIAKGKKLVSKVEDYLSVQQKGDTLFVSVKRLPSETGPFHHYYAQLEATVLIPENVKLEIIGQDNHITLKPRKMKSDWAIENASDISLYIEKNSDINVGAKRVSELVSENGKWTTSSSTQNGIDGENFKNGTFKIGKGTHSIHIVKAYQVSLNIYE